MDVITNPAIPFWGVIPGGLQVGRMISVSGQVPFGAQRFNIDFSRGAGRGAATVALHTNPRFDERIIVRNSFVNGAWQKEERHPNTLPLSTGSDFEMTFLVESTCFKIAINGRHYADFAHRIPISTIDKINIEGNVRIKKIQYSWQSAVPSYPSQPSIYPPRGIGVIPPPAVCPPAFPSTTGPFMPSPPASSLQPVYNPALPFTYPFHGGLSSGMMIYITGRPTACANRFEVNLQTSAPYSAPEIALHINARFDQNCVVRNSRINNSWGPEERHGHMFPFALAVSFDMIIRVESDKFMIALNGRHFAEFRHRIMPLSRVNTVNISGDVIISCVKFQ